MNVAETMVKIPVTKTTICGWKRFRDDILAGPSGEAWWVRRVRLGFIEYKSQINIVLCLFVVDVIVVSSSTSPTTFIVITYFLFVTLGQFIVKLIVSATICKVII